MMEKLLALKPKTRTKKVAEFIFKEVLRKRPRYERGLGKTRMPK